MTADDVEQNLDTQARRLADIDAAITAALEDDEHTVDLPTVGRRQSYAELSASNDELRMTRGWTSIDLDAALTDEQRTAWATWQTRNRLEWRTSDCVAVGAAGMIGLLCSWFDASIDGAIRSKLKGLVDTPLVKSWEAAGKRLPIDYMDTGFGGRAHRVKSAGHDLARPIEAIRQIMSGEFRGVRWTVDGAQRVIDGRFQPGIPVEEAALRLAQHLLADVVTPMSLPIPGMSLLYESDSAALRRFALHAYSGLQPGSGWNVRSGILTPGMSVLVTEILIRTYIHAEAFARTGSVELDWPQQRRRTELLLASHGLVSAVSLGKMTAQMVANSASGNYLRALHPAQIRHANIPALLRTGALAASAITDARRAARIPAARSWEELVVATAQPWQLGLVDRIEAVSETADDALPIDLT